MMFLMILFVAFISKKAFIYSKAYSKECGIHSRLRLYTEIYLFNKNISAKINLKATELFIEIIKLLIVLFL